VPTKPGPPRRTPRAALCASTTRSGRYARLRAYESMTDVDTRHWPDAHRRPAVRRAVHPEVAGSQFHGPAVGPRRQRPIRAFFNHGRQHPIPG
jgi:hypothetical protein